MQPRALLPLAGLALAPSVLAADLFVDAGAACATGNGTAATPYCTIGEALAASAPGDRVLVAPGTYVELLRPLHDVEIIGTAGRGVTTVDGGAAGSTVEFSGITLRMRGLTITGGEAVRGAAVRGTGGTLEVQSSAIGGSEARDPMLLNTGFGAGIHLDGAEVLLDDVCFEDNVAWGGAGALWIALSPRVQLVRCLVQGNFGHNNGAGFINQCTEVLIDSSTFADNTTSFACDPTLALVGCGSVRVINSTFSSANTGLGESVVLTNNQGAELDHCTFVAGCAWPLQGQCTVSNSVFGGLIAPVGSVMSGGHNLVQESGASLVNVQPSDQIGVGPMPFGPLAAGGGATPTHALLPGHPAIGAADPAGALPVDQRGVARLGAVRDSGALQSTVASPSPCSPVVPNSTGEVGRVLVTGDLVASSQALALNAIDLPPGAACLFLTSRDVGFFAGPGGSDGNFCLGTAVGRFSAPGQVGFADAHGVQTLAIDPLALPQPTSFVSAVAGETWRFQAWHRDVGPAGQTSNFTDAAAIVVQ